MSPGIICKIILCLLTVPLLQVLTAGITTAQHYNHNWILQSRSGYGITFNRYINNYPDTLSLPENIQRARTIISDESGNLAFYLGWDGRLYNHSHEMIRGSENLKIHQYGSHSFLAFPDPAGKGLYYLLHTTQSPRQLYYSKINMNARYGKGEVMHANRTIPGNIYGWSTLLAKHEKDDHYWLMVHDADTDSIISFLAGPEGFPLKRTGIRLHLPSATDAKGPFMTITPDSRIFATRILNKQTSPPETWLITGEFNRTTGRVEHLMTIDTITDGTLIRSLALSPGGSKLYVNASRGSKKTIEQYDLSLRLSRSIQKSRITLIENIRIEWGDFAMMTGPDGRIYFSRARYMEGNTLFDPPYIGIIRYPELAGHDCGIESHPYAGWGRPPNLSPALMKTGYIHVPDIMPGQRSPIKLINQSHEPDSVRFEIYRNNQLIDSQTEENAEIRFEGIANYRIEAVRFYSGVKNVIRQEYHFE